MTDFAAKRFWELWRDLREFGLQADDSVSRVAFSDDDIRSRRWIRSIWEQSGCSAQIDGIGNVIGMKGPPPYVLLSSHTDSVPRGGPYDGTVGVLAATVVLEQWDHRKDGGLLVVNWSCEESSRFGIGTVGSHVAVGEQGALQWDRVDGQGQSLRQAAEDAFGWGSVPPWRLEASLIDAALELHIEQGKVLQEAGVPVAIVSTIAAPQRWAITVQGEANHSGSTLVADRRDAIAGAARLVAALDDLAEEAEGRGVHVTTTQFAAYPGVANIIAGEVSLLVDVRVHTEDGLRWLTGEVDRIGEHLRDTRRFRIARTAVSEESPATLHPAVQAVLRATVEASDVPVLVGPSWPSHDSHVLARHVPTGMLFVRNPSGLSHQKGETLDPNDLSVALSIFSAAARNLRALPRA